MSALCEPPLARKQPVVFVFHSSTRILEYTEATLQSRYDVKLLHDEAGLMLALATEPQPALLLLQWHTPERSGAMLEQVSAATPVPILLLIANADADAMCIASRSGASGFLEMPFSRLGLHTAVKLHLRIPDSDGTPFLTQRQETALGDGSSFLRSSARMRAIEAQAATIARTDIPVLILGENGTGKEVLVKYIHQVSNRRDKMFLKVNCAAMPADLLESELFGYEQGAFTGAERSKAGKFEICDGGTIFLDEIGEMPPVLQAKLLQVLQDGTYSRLGGRLPRRVDVRVIAATNIEMKVAMQNKLFREDLYYRLNGFSLTLPPLRERMDEVLIFAQYFLGKAAAKYGRSIPILSARLEEALLGYTWPGNLRELENLMSRYLVIADEASLLSDLASGTSPRTSVLSKTSPATVIDTRRERSTWNHGAESTVLANVLEETKWNRRAAASEMQMSYKALLYRIKRYDLSPPAM